jgi:RNA polymerase sigma-70 factor (ECF subfamily)
VTIEDDDRTLVEAVQANPARFVEIYDRHFYRVWAYVIRRTGNHADAEDVTSEVFRKALEHVRQYEWRGTPFVAWLLRIAANTLVTRWERAARETGKPPEYFGEIAEADGELERRTMLFELVARLPELQRSVIELRFVEGLSITEVAARIGKSEGAVKQLQRRAIEQLRARWETSHA